MKIVIIGDKKENLKLCNNILVSAFRESNIYSANNCIHGMVLCEEKRADIIILNIAGFGNEIIEISEKLKSNINLKNIPILLISEAYSDSDNINMELMDCCDSLLLEPIDERILITQIRLLTRINKAEEVLFKTWEPYELVANKMTDVVWLMDLMGRSIFVSPSIMRFTGFSEQEYLDQTIDERFVKESAVYGKKIFSKELSKFGLNNEVPKDYSMSMKLEYNCKNGGSKWGELVITPYFDGDSNLLGIHGVTRDVSEKVEADIKLEKERLNGLTALIDGQELERQRISMELHDGLGQQLAGIKMKLENSATQNLKQTRQTVNEVKNDFKKMMDEIRFISNNVSPTILADWGLVPSLSELYKEFKKNSGIEFEFTVMGNFKDISQKVAFSIYRIIQEVLTNAAKHSNAKTVKLALIEKEKVLLMLMEDDGTGLLSGTRRGFKGNGINNIKQRTKLLNGEFSIDSEKGVGTIIRVRIPK